MNEKLTLGEFIRQSRKEKKLTLKELAEITSLTHGYLSKVENNQYTPKISTLEAIADSLDISYEKLVELAGYIVKSDLDKLNEAITKLKGLLYICLKNQKYLTENKFESAEYWDNKDQFIKLDSDLKILENLRDQAANKNEVIENLDEILKKIKFPEIQDLDFAPLPVKVSKATTDMLNIPREIHEKEVEKHNLANMLSNDFINYKGIKLTENDKKLIINVLEGIKSQFENYK